jgi:hypothetical protein
MQEKLRETIVEEVRKIKDKKNEKEITGGDVRKVE